MWWPVFFSVLIILALYLAAVYNALLAKRRRVKQGWNKVNAQLKQRLERISAIINIVKDHIDVEAPAWKELLLVHAESSQAKGIRKKEKSERDLFLAVSALSVIVEENKQLMENPELLQAADRMGMGEEALQIARVEYNYAVLQFNNALKSPLNSLIAMLIQLSAVPFFQLEEMEAISAMVAAAEKTPVSNQLTEQKAIR
ncbi:MAG: LemA family protein [Alphaproteobacteria bacterium]